MTIKNVRMGNNSLKLKKFDLAKISKDATVVIIAKRGSGKSFLIRDLLYHHRDMSGCVIVCPTEHINKFYSDICPQTFIYDAFDPTLIPRIFKRQTYINDKNDIRKRYGKPLLNNNICLLFDDMMASSATWLKDPGVIDMFMNGRHYKNTMFLISLQYSLGIPTHMRSNVDYVFLLGENFTNNKQKLHKHYAGMFPREREFIDVFDQVTDNYGCMVIDNKSRSNNIQDTVFWYKAVKRPNFTIGNTHFKKTHESVYDNSHNKRDMFAFNSNKSGIIVEKMR